ncbi:MAG: hypothetical protein RLZZ367_723 [Bacteroidota bacterium]|jgi:VIT1/CCC1 family predicted Fe2+/Mn2+ transporter
MNIALWIAQATISLTLILGGFMRAFAPGKLPFKWISENPNLNIFTSILDILVGICLVLPALLHIDPMIAVYAAITVVAIMIGAVIFHISRGEAKDIGFNIFVLIVAVFIAYGRMYLVPF